MINLYLVLLQLEGSGRIWFKCMLADACMHDKAAGYGHQTKISLAGFLWLSSEMIYDLFIVIIMIFYD